MKTNSKIVITVLLVTITLTGVFIFHRNADTAVELIEKSVHASLLSDVIVDCHPQDNATEAECTKRGCMWEEHHGKDAPVCIYPEGHGYRLSGEINSTAKGLKAEIKRQTTPNIYGGTVYNDLIVSVEYQTENRVRLKIFPKSVKRYEVPAEALDIKSPATPPNPAKRMYTVKIEAGPPQFGVVVQRRSNNVTIFSTSVPGLTFSDQFIQITTRLPSDNLYGFGEHNHRQFKHDMNWKTWSIFNRDAGPIDPVNLYGAHPVYMNIEDDGKATMVLLKNSNGMDVSLHPDPNPAVTYRVLGGLLDFYIFIADSPQEVVTQYIEAIGKPVIPPYWALGFQLCRWGYKDLDDMKMVMDRNKAAGIPYDVQWADIDFMYRNLDFTYDKAEWFRLPELVKDIHKNHQRFVIIADPGISSNRSLINGAKRNNQGFNMFDDGVRKDVFIKDSSGNILMGEVWPGITAYPDFTSTKSQEWWFQWIDFFYKVQHIEYDAIWIDMNEPSNFVEGSSIGCNNNSLNYPPFRTKIMGTEIDGRLFSKTICMDNQQAWGKHYDVHNLYAHSEAMRTYKALLKLFPGKRPWTMTRSSFVGTGKYATKWMGDNQSRWPQLHWSIVGIMEFSMFGFAMNGADICGFWYEAEYEMCIRWHQLGAFYPFSRNHNGKGDAPTIFKHQDPAGWDQRFIDIVKPVLMTRYRLLPYLYTLMFKAHQYGHMVMKALLFEFPQDKNTWDIDRQFMLGPALMISPVLEKNQTVVDAYFPKARWYDYHTGEEVMPTGKVHQLYTPLDKYNLHIRGGHVIPWQEPSTTTYDSRRNNFGIIIALDENHLANGELFWDDGESLDTHDNKKSSITTFTMKRAGELEIHTGINNYPQPYELPLRVIEIYGLDYIPQYISIGARRVSDEYIRQSGKIVQIVDLDYVTLKTEDHLFVRWREY